MFFLVQMKIKVDGNVEKGASQYDTMHDAAVQFHVAMSSAMTKDDVRKFTAVILSENGLVQKVEVYEKTVVEAVEESSDTPETVEN